MFFVVVSSIAFYINGLKCSVDRKRGKIHGDPFVWIGAFLFVVSVESYWSGFRRDVHFAAIFKLFFGCVYSCSSWIALNFIFFKGAFYQITIVVMRDIYIGSLFNIQTVQSLQFLLETFLILKCHLFVLNFIFVLSFINLSVFLNNRIFNNLFWLEFMKMTLDRFIQGFW